VNLKEYLEKEDACKPAIKWLGDRTPEQAWVECERGDWLDCLHGEGGSQKDCFGIMRLCQGSFDLRPRRRKSP
jgi:hypothetical protein